MARRRIKSLEDLRTFCNRLAMRKFPIQPQFEVVKRRVNYNDETIRCPCLMIKLPVRDIKNNRLTYLYYTPTIPFPRLGRKSYCEKQATERVMLTISRMVLHEVFETLTLGKQQPFNPHRSRSVESGLRNVLASDVEPSYWDWTIKADKLSYK